MMIQITDCNCDMKDTLDEYFATLAILLVCQLWTDELKVVRYEMAGR